MQGDSSVVAALCRSLQSMMQELEAETAQRIKLQAELGTLRAAQQRQNAALAALSGLCKGGKQ